MKRLVLILMTALVPTPAGFAREQTILARITVYWHFSGDSQCVSSNGSKLRKGHCAVDPAKIPYGSKVVFPDLTCVAVDTGPAVVSRTAARKCGKTPSQRDALVIDRYFETKAEALAWAAAHPHFMNVRVSDSRRSIADQTVANNGSSARIMPNGSLAIRNRHSAAPKPDTYTGNSSLAPAEGSQPLLLTPSGTALPRS